MSLPALALRRPVLATVCSILIVLFGILGFKRLGVREFPAIDPPTITVRTNYTGSNAEIIETQITEPLEKAINGIAGVKSILSTSAVGNSTVTVEFVVGSALEQAANDVRDKVAQALRDLPQDIDAPPVVTKADANGDPVIFLPVQSTTRSHIQLGRWVEDNLVERLQTISGVSGVNVFGNRRPAMRLWLDPQKLAARSLTIQDIKAALDRENVELPSGKIFGNTTELIVKTFGRLSTEDDFNTLIIKQLDGQTIRLRDIGEAVLGPENEETIFKKNGVAGVSCAIVPQPGANLVAIADEFYKRFEAIKKDVPADIILDIGIDKSIFVRRSIREVEETLLIAIGLVVLVIYFFFRNWLVAFRPLIDIPVSLIGAFFVMWMAGFSINVLTLLGIVLATGLVVDDGIVVTENIFKKIEEGKSPAEAAREGTEEIFFAVIATSITLAVVFLPIIFLEGFVGRLFREFGVVVAGAVVISAFVSLTLTPVLSVKFAGKNHADGWFYKKTEPFFRGLDNGYRLLLTKFMRIRWVVLPIIAACFGIIYFYGNKLPTELAPLEDRSLIRMPLTGPEGISYEKMENWTDRVTQFVMDSVPEARLTFSSVANSFGGGQINSGFCNFLLTDPEMRPRSQQQIVDYLNKKKGKLNDGLILTIQEQTISSGFASAFQLPVQFVIQNIDFEKIREKLPKFMEEMGKNTVFQGTNVNLKFTRPELKITIDRLKASELGVSTLDISSTLQLALSGRRFGYFLQNGKQYQVIGQVDRADRDAPDDLRNFYVKNREGRLISLDNLIKMEESAAPPQLFHYNRMKSATVSAGLAPNRTLGEGIAAVREIAKTTLDDTFTTALTGASRDFEESSSNTSFAFGLALLLIFLILAAQFESFRSPFIILFTVPLAIAGALLALAWTGQTLNIFSQIGMIMLIGLATKNGILIVDFANKIRRKHPEMSRIEAGIEAGCQRLRPILMTSIATIFGALPIAMQFGSAGRSRVPLGVVIVGGLSVAMVLSLFVVPVIYSVLSPRKVGMGGES
jgi:multidrug efflux pump